MVQTKFKECEETTEILTGKVSIVLGSHWWKTLVDARARPIACGIETGRQSQL